jgi:hypothetical protein
MERIAPFQQFLVGGRGYILFIIPYRSTKTNPEIQKACRFSLRQALFRYGCITL